MRCPRCFRKLARDMACPADGAQPTREEHEDDAPPAPPVVPGWRVAELIASGGQAAVWRGRRDDGAEAAIKVAHAGGPEVVASFAREAAAMRTIGPPAVPTVFADGALPDGRPYLAMELVAGTTLGAHLARAAGPLAIDEALAWLRGVAGALTLAHAAGVVHGDLKPDNIVRAADGAVRLLDLGMARRLVDDGAPATAGGTTLYMAPEQVRGEPLSAATDLYGLGAVGFEAVTTRPPFVGDRTAVELGHLSFRAPRASTVRPVPPQLDELLAACLAKAPAQRPASAAAVVTALAAIDGAELVTGVAPVAVANRSSVALVAVERAPTAHNLDALVRARGGQVARQTPGRAILAFVPDDCPAPVAAALATAATLAELGARTAVHVTQLVVRRGKDGRAMLFGPPLDQPGAWLPTSTASGVLLTAAAARELDGGQVETIDGGQRLRPRPEVDAAPAPATTGPMLGADARVASALASAAAALTDGPPATWLALGAAGAGKSRLVDELAARVAAAHPEAAVVRLAGARTFGAGAAAAVRALRAQLDAIAPGPDPSAALPLTAEVRAAIDAALTVGPLAIVVDDAHWIDDALMTALGVAARTATGPLWLAATATEALAAARPTWLDGARVSVERLAPLDDADARVLLRRALAPARRVPEALVARLAARCGGSPGVLTALARELRRAGVIRRHPGSEVWFVAADELDFLPPAPGVQWFVTRQLAGLGPGLAELARAIALLGAEFEHDVVEAVTQVPAAGVRIDPGVGLDQLARAGVVVAHGASWRFHSEAEQDAIADTAPAPVARAVHAAALAHVRARGDDAATWARMAFHAARAGDAATAVRAAERLAADAQARHAPLEAERWLTLALDQLGDDPPPAARLRLLGARGHTRRLLTHYEAAQTDLRAARELALALGDPAAAIDLQVADGAVCDFTERLGESARLIEDAAAAAPAGLPAAVRARLDNWLGVVRARQERLDDARALLTAAIDAADRLGDHATAIGSRLMLGGVLRRLGQLDEGLAVLDRAIAQCDLAGDHFHLAIGLFNRVNVWRQLDRPAAATADAERAIAIANRMGLDQVELWGWYDLSLLRFWAGDLAGALAASEAAHRIGSERFREAPPVVASVWYALLLATAGELPAARRELDSLRVDDLGDNPFLTLTRDLALLVCADELEVGWDAVIEQARRDTADPEDAVFVWWTRARTARRLGAAAAARAYAEAAAAAAAALGRACPPVAWPGEEP
ncbi:MAG: protein kinase [Myxococcales bacterium]|nr:protein kinase [Myxococcales bacterium]